METGAANMNRLRFLIDPVYYQNKVSCVCLCHNECHYEMRGMICDGCYGRDGRVPGNVSWSPRRACSFVEDLIHNTQIPLNRHTENTGKEQEAVHVKGDTLTGRA